MIKHTIQLIAIALVIVLAEYAAVHHSTEMPDTGRIQSRGGVSGVSSDIRSGVQSGTKSAADRTSPIQSRTREKIDPAGGRYGLHIHAMLPSLEISTPLAFARSPKKQARLTLVVADNGSGFTAVRFMQDDRVIAPARTVFERNEAGKRTMRQVYAVRLSRGTNTFTATAENDNHQAVAANPVEVYYGADAPTLFVLAIGINRYSNKLLSLNFARNDAEAVVQQLSGAGNVLFKRTEVTSLYDDQATSSTVQAALDKIGQRARPNDVFLLYYAGHGSAVGGQYYFVTSENAKLYDRDSLKRHAISAVQLQKKLLAIHTRKQLVMIDACQSGAAARPLIAEREVLKPTLKRLSTAASVFVIASSGKQEYSNEMEKLGHGSFTYALLQGLKGDADTNPADGRITVTELESYLQRNVPDLARKFSSDSQFPTIASVGSDFPIAIVHPNTAIASDAGSR